MALLPHNIPCVCFKSRKWIIIQLSNVRKELFVKKMFRTLTFNPAICHVKTIIFEWSGEKFYSPNSKLRKSHLLSFKFGKCKDRPFRRYMNERVFQDAANTHLLAMPEFGFTHGIRQSFFFLSNSLKLEKWISCANQALFFCFKKSIKLRIKLFYSMLQIRMTKSVLRFLRIIIEQFLEK